MKISTIKIKSQYETSYTRCQYEKIYVVLLKQDNQKDALIYYIGFFSVNN